MRKDMPKVIIDCYRYTSPFKKRRNRNIPLEEMPFRASIRGKLGFSEKEKNDRISPFNRFLMKMERKKVPFDKVYSMIKRSDGGVLRKIHLLEHFHASATKAEDGKLKLKKLF